MIAASEILHFMSRPTPPPGGVAAGGQDPLPTIGSLTVLVVEDESVIGWALQSLLEDLGHEVVGVVGSGEAAVRVAALRRPELVVMDIQLGKGLDGIEAAGQILAAGSPKVIFASAYGDDGTRARIAECVPGAPLVSKPVSMASVRTAIAKAFMPGQ
jgi:CheY-like chemotaxis protein